MATDHLQIPDISASQNQKEVTANAAHNLLDRALNQLVQKTMAAGANTLTAIEMRENIIIEAIGTPGAAWQLDMFDTNERFMVVYNNTDDQGTIRNSASGGTGQPVIEIGEASLFHYDGTNFIDITDAAIAATTWLGLTDTPNSFVNLSGQMSVVNDAETALEFIKTAVKLPVVAASTANVALATDVEAGDALDGVTLAENDRILLKNQTTASENGIYVVAATGAPARSADFDDDADVEGGVFVAVNNEGTVNGDTIWMLSDDDTVVVGTDNQTWVQHSSVGTFTGLSDTPGSLSNAHGKRLVSNSGETALEFEGNWWKDAVTVATTANITLSGEQTIDGILTAADRVLVKNQSTASENGIYVVAATGAPARSANFDICRAPAGALPISTLRLSTLAPLT